MSVNDARVVDAFRLWLTQATSAKFRLIERPDERDRTGRACDAIFECDGRKYAAEHTSIDSFPNQRRDNHRFTKVIVRVEEAMKGVFGGTVEFSVPVHSIPTGVDWQDMPIKIERWCRAHVDAIPYNVPTLVSIPGLPFTARILRYRDHDFGFSVSRDGPQDLEDQRVTVIKMALETRVTKLPHYKARGCRTILLLEYDDIALGNLRLIGDAFKRALTETSLTPATDDVFLVRTGFEPFMFLCLKLGDTIWPESWTKWQGYQFLY